LHAGNDILLITVFVKSWKATPAINSGPRLYEKKMEERLSLPMKPVIEFYLGFTEENWRRIPEQCPNITIVSCSELEWGWRYNSSDVWIVLGFVYATVVNQG
jgi:hypothetical protein